MEQLLFRAGERSKREWMIMASLLFCRAVAVQGRDTYSLQQSEEDELITVARFVPEKLHLDFFHVGSWGTLSDQAATLSDALYWIEHNCGDWKNLSLLRDDMNVLGGVLTPWEQGYALARTMRTTLGCNGQKFSSLEELGQLLGRSVD